MQSIPHDIAYFMKIQNAYGSDSLKQTTLRQAAYRVNRDFKHSLNWEKVVIDDRDEYQDALITPGSNATIKNIKSRPGEVIKLGAVVYWSHTYWLVETMDYDDQLHCSGTMNQCNTVLKWQKPDGTILTQVAVAEDATKYGTGVQNTVYMQIGEFSLKVKVPLNEETLAINRDKRFLIGQNDPVTGLYKPKAFIASRINQVTGTHTLDADNSILSDGYIEITMMEDQFKPNEDNAELGIADYFDYSQPDSPLTHGEDQNIEQPKVDGVTEGGWFG